MAIRLPHDAHGYDYEDQICSLLHASGYYLETRLILKKGTEEVLEFDAIATPVNNYQDRIVVEVKSGKWGISDVFKLYGQIMYTSEERAWLIHKKPNSETKKQAISEVTESIPVKTLYVNSDDSGNSVSIPDGLELDQAIAKTIYTTSWWSRSAERIAQSKFKEWCKGQADPPDIVLSAQQYLASISDCLFKKNPLSRVNALYSAYKFAPQLTSNLVQYTSEVDNETLSSVRKSVFDRDGRPHLQYVASQEYRSRLAIIKNAYDALLEEENSQKQQGKEFIWQDFIKAILPANFQHGMAEVRDYEHAQKLPFFLQIFIEVFGGFYCPNDDRELQYISQATGIPVDHIPGALDMLDKFFPINNGWIHDGDRVRFLKGLPSYLRGAGCFAREDIYGKDWSKQFPQLAWQIPNWHNALYRLLEPSLKVDE